ncbi:MAG: FAD-dependent oxidoreductase [Jannaschia sp.]
MTDVLIIGGGLSGLAMARLLHGAGRSFMVIEGRDRFGGRILTDSAGIDLGPAWIWPGQPRIAALLRSLDLRTYPQHGSGEFLHENDVGIALRGRGRSILEGALRIVGGMGKLVDTLVHDLPEGSLRTGSPVVEIVRDADGVTARTADGQEFKARRVVLALPPRLTTRIRFAPDLPDGVERALSAVPTWMAAHAKAVAVYDRPFWRMAGLSGDAVSQTGPLAEIHDACGPGGGPPYALFGFQSAAPVARLDEEATQFAILEQLDRLFGPEAARPVSLHLKDWSHDPMTASQADHNTPPRHPVYGIPRGAEALWDGRLLLAGTEMAATSGGYLEGALEAAGAAFAQIAPEDVRRLREASPLSRLRGSNHPR